MVPPPLARFVLLISACLAVLIVSCSTSTPEIYHGYVEADFLLVASPLAGQIEKLFATQGMSVAAGDVLYSLERKQEAAAVSEAEQNALQAEHRLADLSKGKRPSEIAGMEAGIRQAQANFALAESEFKRREKLLQEQTIAREEYDRARSEMDRSRAAVEQLTAELTTAGLKARVDTINAARAEHAAALNRLQQARWRLEQKIQAAPQNGTVYDIFYVEGEFVPAGYPVVSLLPPSNLKIRFFIPEPLISTLKIKQPLLVSLDGTDKKYRAIITYISAKAEYTPPVIYSRETRSKLVFMIEAKVTDQDGSDLHPGQPVDVRLEPMDG